MISYNKLRQLGRDSGLDIINLFVDYCFRNELFEFIDNWLDNLDIEKLTDDHLIGILTATLPAKSKLPTRVNFLEDVIDELKRRETWEEKLLEGLE